MAQGCALAGLPGAPRGCVEQVIRQRAGNRLAKLPGQLSFSLNSEQRDVLYRLTGGRPGFAVSQVLRCLGLVGRRRSSQALRVRIEIGRSSRSA